VKRRTEIDRLRSWLADFRRREREAAERDSHAEPPPPVPPEKQPGFLGYCIQKHILRNPFGPHPKHIASARGRRGHR
jgi:hypothetical protein